MITRTPKRNLYDTNRPNTKGYYIGNADSAILLITVLNGGTAGFINFKGSAQEKEIDISLPANKDNFYTSIAVNDLDTGKVYEGSVGISVATPRLIMVELNTRYLSQIAIDDQFDAGAIINIDIVCIQN